MHDFPFTIADVAGSKALDLIFRRERYEHICRNSYLCNGFVINIVYTEKIHASI